MHNVEKCLDKRFINDNVEYCTKWFDFDHIDNRLQPEVNLVHAEKVLEYDGMQSTNKSIKFDSISQVAEEMKNKDVINNSPIKEVAKEMKPKGVINNSLIKEVTKKIEPKGVINSSITKVADKNERKDEINKTSINQVSEESEHKDETYNSSINQVAVEIEHNPVIDIVDNNDSTVGINKVEHESEVMRIEHNVEGRKLEVIVDCTDVGGELFFCVKWVGVETEAYVPATVANHNWPLKVVEFYVRKLKQTPLFAEIEKL